MFAERIKQVHSQKCHRNTIYFSTRGKLKEIALYTTLIGGKCSLFPDVQVINEPMTATKSVYVYALIYNLVYLALIDRLKDRSEVIFIIFIVRYSFSHLNFNVFCNLKFLQKTKIVNI